MGNENMADVQLVIDALLICSGRDNRSCLECNRYREALNVEFVSDCAHGLMLEAVRVLKAQQMRIAELEAIYGKSKRP